MERRDFIKGSIAFSMLMLVHRQAQAVDQFKTKESKQAEHCRFPEITLYTSKLKEQFAYYSKTLNFPIIDSDKSQFSMRLGESILRFKEVTDGSSPFYHYAINIPSNKYKKARKWLLEKTPLLVDQQTGEDLLYFDFWDAHAMYFKDPAGNIGELISRHTLDNDREGAFGISDLLCVSEIGVPVENPRDLAQELKAAYNLDTFGSSMFIGDENGLFVTVPVDRLWFPEYTQKAAVYPTEIQLTDKGKEQFQFEDYPYKITRKRLSK